MSEKKTFAGFLKHMDMPSEKCKKCGLSTSDFIIEFVIPYGDSDMVDYFACQLENVFFVTVEPQSQSWD